MMHPFLDLAAATAEQLPEIESAITRVLHSGMFIRGSEVAKFEAEWASYCEASNCVSVGNGLDALVIALTALGVGPGDEVIVPAHTFIASWLAIEAVGATIVPVDVDPNTYLIDIESVRAVYTKRAKVLMVVHLYGQPVDMTSVQLVAQELGLKVVEDAAQAHGAMHGGRRIGAHSDAVCWSFYPGKNLGALGDGGAVTTNDDNLADLMRMVSNYGSKKKYEHSVIGVNSRLDEVQAAILRVKLSRLTEWNARRAEIAAEYIRQLSDTCVTLPHVAEGAVPVWHLFVVKVQNRDLVQQRLREIGVETLIHYPIPCHQQRAFSGRKWPNMPMSERLAAEILSLPIGPHTDLSVCSAVANLLRREF